MTQPTAMNSSKSEVARLGNTNVDMGGMYMLNSIYN